MQRSDGVPTQPGPARPKSALGRSTGPQMGLTSRPAGPVGRGDTSIGNREEAVKRPKVGWKPAPRKPVSAPLCRRQPEAEDPVTGMVRRNLHHLLSRIFLAQSDETLAASRQVCSVWWRYLRNIFWRDPVVRRELEARLEARWRAGRCHRVLLQGLAGALCKRKCKENFRDCHCLERLQCAASGNSVTVDWGGCSLTALRREGEGTGPLLSPPSSLAHTFPAPQFQVSLHMGLGLHLDTSTWLSTPVFLSPGPRPPGTKHQAKPAQASAGPLPSAPGPGGLTVEAAPGPHHGLLVRAGAGAVVGRAPGSGPRGPEGPVEQLQVAGGLVAALAGGRVTVHSIAALARGARQEALLYRSPAPGEGEPGVHFLHLSPSTLLTVAGTNMHLADFWKFDWTPATKEFLL